MVRVSHAVPLIRRSIKGVALDVEALEICAETSGRKRMHSISTGYSMIEKDCQHMYQRVQGEQITHLVLSAFIVRLESRTSMAVSLALGDEFTRPGSGAAASAASSY